MADIQGDFGNMIHGVSKQPDERKFKGQCREQINCSSNVTSGLTRRSPFKHINVIASNQAQVDELINSKFTIMDSEPYPLIVGLGLTQPQAWSFDGSIIPVDDTGTALDYYQEGTSKPLDQKYFPYTVLDTMFISNTEVAPQASEVTDDTPPRGQWIEFGVFAPGTEFLIERNGVSIYEGQVFDGYVKVGTDGTPDPDEKLRTKEYEGSWHAEQFMAENLGWVQYNGWVFIDDDVAEYKVVKGGISITAHDSNKVTSVENLPPYGVNGTYVVVEEGAGEDRNRGYFESRSTATDMGAVSWHEVVKYGEGQTITARTMPHSLFRSTENTLTLSELTWSPRQVGDVDNNPLPGFLEYRTPIETIGLFQNRLLMTSGESILASASDDYYDLFASSAFYNTDADPFETHANTANINNLKSMLEHDGDLVLFSNNSQFKMSGEINHTYETAYVQVIGSYKSTLNALPVATGDSVLFGFQYGNFAGIREMYTSEATDQRKAESITAHINDYMQGEVRHLTTSSNVDSLVVLLEDDSRTLYIYEFTIIDGEKAQQSWSKWEMPTGYNVLWCEFYEAELFLVAEVATVGGAQLHLMSLSWDEVNTGGLPFPVKADGLFPITNITYNEALDTSTWESVVQRLDLVFVEDGTEDPGFVVNATVREDGITWDALGDYSDATLWSGIPYDSRYTFANPVIRDADGNAMTLDRLQLGRMFMHFTQVGQVSFTYADSHGRSKTVDFNNRRINSLNNRMSYVPTENGNFPVSIRKKVDGLEMTLHTNDVTPFTVRAVEFRGEYQQKGQRR